jgi:hypothetical protein
VNAAFEQALVKSLQERNIVSSSDQVTERFPGELFDVERLADNFELGISDGSLFGDYIFEFFAASQRVRARCWYDMRIAINAEGPTWGEATFAWNSPFAMQQEWRPLLDISSSIYPTIQIAPEATVYPDGMVELWPFEFDANGVIIGAAPSEGVYHSEQGVLVPGYLAADNSRPLLYAVTPPGSFSMSFLTLMKAPQTHYGTALGAVTGRYVALEILRLFDASNPGTFLKLMYKRDDVAPYFVLKDGIAANDVKIPIVDGNADLRLAFGIVQTSTERRLYLYNFDTALYYSAVKTVGPAGASPYSRISV